MRLGQGLLGVVFAANGLPPRKLGAVNTPGQSITVTGWQSVVLISFTLRSSSPERRGSIFRPQKIPGKSPKLGETSNPSISGNFAEDCSGSNPDFEVEFRTVREAKAESAARGIWKSAIVWR